MPLKLYEYQLDAINKLKTGSILCGGVGSGKSLTSLGYYYLQNGGSVDWLTGSSKNYIPMKKPCDLYIITTARKRDTCEWEKELTHFLMSTNPEVNRYKKQKIVIDSWNNIQKYIGVKNSFFIFDEQRLVGNGTWVKSFYRIAEKNDWILLSATPGDNWSDYIPVFVANGFFRNRSEFVRNHIVYARYTKFPKIDRYLNTGRLIRLRNRILVDMEFNRTTISHHEDVYVRYDVAAYKDLIKKRWNPWTNLPITNAGELCLCLRKIVNSDESRQIALLDIVADHPKCIIFYSFDYELDILRNLGYVTADGRSPDIAEWNGHKHQPIPDSDCWVYLVQYTAGAEGWNCIKTDTIVFYSQQYSYKILHQSCGRIDRLNTPFKDLYYYHLKSRSSIDLAINNALSKKKNFNEGKFVKW